jgi:two-component system cell cycle response regulator DivK
MSDQPVILYIEDNPDNRMLVYRVLRAEGFDIHSVPDGRAGLNFLEEQTPNLILMDINLPEIDGYTLTTLLKSRPELIDVTNIALTANVRKGDREKSYEAGCEGYLQTPINDDHLGNQIMSYLEAVTY